MKFDEFLCKRNDEIDNAAFDFLKVLYPKIEWDMSMIGEIEDYANEILAERGMNVCYPYVFGDDEWTPCYNCGCQCECPMEECDEKV